MKRVFVIVGTVLLYAIACPCSLLSNSITINNVIGSFGGGVDDTVMVGSNIKFMLRYENTSGLPLSIVNGFVVYSPNGATWSGPLQIDTLTGPGAPLTRSSGNFDVVFATSIFDGSSRDTFGIGGVRLTGPGLPPGYSNIPYGLGIGSFDAAEDGLTVCIDSAYYRPAGQWRWSHSSLGNFAPSWVGPYCYTIFTCCPLPPFITNAPVDITRSHCETMAYDFNATDPQGGPVQFELLSGPGTINQYTGVWMWDGADLSDVGASIEISVRPCAQYVCGPTVVVPIIVTNGPPVIDGCGGMPAMIAEGDTVSARVEAYDECLGSSVVWSAEIVNGNGGSDHVSISSGGWVTFVAGFDGAPRDVDIQVVASDSALSDICALHFRIEEGAWYEVQIGETSNAKRGEYVDVPVTLNSAGPDGMGGYSFLIGYDQSRIMLSGIRLGDPFGPSGCGWEYFTYRFAAFGNCTANCPSGLFQVAGIAETNIGPYHPSCNVPSTLPAEMFRIEFLVSSDPIVACQTNPIQFFWLDCTDNIISNDNASVLYISDSIWNSQPETAPINATEGVEFPTYFGAQEECLLDPDGTGPRFPPHREVNFRNGRIEIVCADSSDCRGDVNGNGVPYEVADLVRLLVYFTYLCGDFPPPDCPPRIECSDINGDGLVFTVADLVYLIRIIVGDAKPIHKIATEDITITRREELLETNATLSAALVIVEGETTPTLLADGMEMQSHFDGVNTRIVITPPFAEGTTRVASFTGPFLAFEGSIVSVEVSPPDGQSVPKVTIRDIPVEFRLEQNYPNPFNPGTTIEFSLPVAGPVMLRIYNLLGQEVTTLLDGPIEAGRHRAEWNGQDREGQAVPSGVYLYRLATGNVVQVRKMILLR